MKKVKILLVCLALTTLVIVKTEKYEMPLITPQYVTDDKEEEI